MTAAADGRIAPTAATGRTPAARIGIARPSQSFSCVPFSARKTTALVFKNQRTPSNARTHSFLSRPPMRLQGHPPPTASARRRTGAGRHLRNGGKAFVTRREGLRNSSGRPSRARGVRGRAGQARMAGTVAASGLTGTGACFLSNLFKNVAKYASAFSGKGARILTSAALATVILQPTQGLGTVFFGSFSCQNVKKWLIVWPCQQKVLPLHTQMRSNAVACSESILYRGVEQLVARQAHNLEVACSSPASATTRRVASCKTVSYPSFFDILQPAGAWVYRPRRNSAENYADLLDKPLFTDRWRANQQSGANYAGFTDQNQFFYRVGPHNPRLYLFAQAFFLLLKRRAP